MTTNKKEFHRGGKGFDEHCYYVGRDMESNELFVEHAWSVNVGGVGYASEWSSGSDRYTLQDFKKAKSNIYQTLEAWFEQQKSEMPNAYASWLEQKPLA